MPCIDRALIGAASQWRCVPKSGHFCRGGLRRRRPSWSGGRVAGGAPGGQAGIRAQVERKVLFRGDEGNLAQCPPRLAFRPGTPALVTHGLTRHPVVLSLCFAGPPGLPPGFSLWRSFGPTSGRSPSSIGRYRCGVTRWRATDAGCQKCTEKGLLSCGGPGSSPGGPSKGRPDWGRSGAPLELGSSPGAGCPRGGDGTSGPTREEAGHAEMEA